MYNIIIISNTINKSYNSINTLGKCYKLIIDNYRTLKAMNCNSFSIVLHNGDDIVLRLNNKHCITKDTLAYNDLINTWKAYA